MAFDFPSAPALNQEYTSAGVTYFWNGYAWAVKSAAPVAGNYVLKTGDVMTGDLRLTYATPAIILDKTTIGSSPTIYGKYNGLTRWAVGVADGTESGANAGSNVVFTRYDDAGNSLGTLLTLNRAGGYATLEGSLFVRYPLVFSNISNFQMGYGGIANITTGTSTFYIAFAGNDRYSFQASAGFRPVNDNMQVLGSGSQRWTQIYAVSTTISASDERAKQDIRELDEAEVAVARRLKGLIRAYKWIESVEEKGADARIHVGVIAQRVEEAFTAEGLDARRYGMFCVDEIEEYVPPVVETDEFGVDKVTVESYYHKTGEIRYSVRYEQLAMFILAGLV